PEDRNCSIQNYLRATRLFDDRAMICLGVGDSPSGNSTAERRPGQWTWARCFCHRACSSWAESADRRIPERARSQFTDAKAPRRSCEAGKSASESGSRSASKLTSIKSGVPRGSILPRLESDRAGYGFGESTDPEAITLAFFGPFNSKKNRSPSEM